MVETQHSSMADAPRVFERAPGEVEIHELRPRHTAVVRSEVPPERLKEAITGSFPEVAHVLAASRVQWAGPPFARYLEWGPERVVVEAGAPVHGPIRPSGRVVPGELPGGTVASIVHIGGYERILETYARLGDWLRAERHGDLGPMWEVYWSDPQAEPDPTGWRTEILTPLSGS